MERPTFTNDEITILNNSTYVVNATEKTVSFTKEFKELFWAKYSEGTSPRQIVVEAGFDAAMFTDNRLWGLVTTLRRLKEKGLPFTNGRNHTSKKSKFDMPKTPKKPKFTLANVTDKDIKKLMHQVAYMSQELEFLKKIILIDGGKKSK
ncbi:MAG: HTH domain-containing protein [Clostridia bacterium]